MNSSPGDRIVDLAKSSLWSKMVSKVTQKPFSHLRFTIRLASIHRQSRIILFQLFLKPSVGFVIVETVKPVPEPFDELSNRQHFPNLPPFVQLEQRQPQAEHIGIFSIFSPTS